MTVDGLVGVCPHVVFMKSQNANFPKFATSLEATVSPIYRQVQLPHCTEDSSTASDILDIQYIM